MWSPAFILVVSTLGAIVSLAAALTLPAEQKAVAGFAFLSCIGCIGDTLRKDTDDNDEGYYR